MLRASAILFILCADLLAQTNGHVGSIGGFVSDSAGAPIPQAAVRVLDESTELRRQTVTNDAGVYEFRALPPGNYEIRVEASGFAISVQRIAVTVGGAVRVNFAMTLASNAQTVNLSGTAASVAESIPTDIMMQDEIRNLPINGRRFQDFATLSSTVQALPETLGQLSFAGQRGIYGNVMLDGADYNEPFLGGIRGGDRANYAFTIPQSAIQEFQTVLAAPSVEYGHTTGGVLNAVTRSGSNSLHGEAFYQIRDEALSAADPLGRQSLERQQQFGGAAGGPIRRGRLFFFGAAEQQFAGFPRQVRYSALDAFQGQLTPAITPGYNYLRSLERPFDQTNDVTSVFGRADYQVKRGDRIAVRYNHSRNQARNAVAAGAPVLPEVNQSLATNGNIQETTHGAGGQWTSVVSSKAVNDFRLQYSREDSAISPNATAPFVDLGAIGSFGTAPNLPRSSSDYRLQAADGLSIVRGRHTMALGFDYSYLGVEQHAGENQFGAFSIAADPLHALEILSGAAGNNRFDDPSVTYARQVGSLQFSGNVHQPAAYAQDTWRVSPTLTFALGLRWEGQINPTPIADNDFVVTNVRDFAFPLGRVDPTLIRNQMAQWSPRASFAWDPTGKQNTVIRGKGGIFYAQTPLAYLAGPLTDVSMGPSDLTLQIAPSSAGTVYGQFLAGGFDLNRYPLNSLPIFTVPDIWVQVAGKPNPFAKANVITTSGESFRNPRSAQIGLTVEHRLTNGLAVFYEFDHLNTVHLERNVDWNVPQPSVKPGDQSLRPFFGLRSGTPRPNPNLGFLLVRDSSARSNYVGHTFRAEYRTGRLLIAAHYTLSFNRSDDDNERQLTGITYQNPYDFSREYNWSAIDARHQVAGYSVWNAPRGLTLSCLFNFRSGLPIDASTGGDTSELLSGNVGNRPLLQPNVPMRRNAFRNRPFGSVGFRIAKSIMRREALRLDLMGDLFNAFNFDNVAFISSTVYPNNPAFVYGLGVQPNGQLAPVNPGFMKLRTADGNYDPQTTAQLGSPLQAQVGLRLTF